MGTVIIGDRSIALADGMTIAESVSVAGEHPDAFIFMIGGRPVPMDTVPPEDSEVRAVRVASGG